ncbi:MAG: hypothetical protein ABIH23_28740 [bacterium]
MSDSGFRRLHISLAFLVTATVVAVGVSFAEDEKPKGDAYPLDTCIVTGQKLGAMGEPVIYDQQGRELRFCCKACVKTFESKTSEYLEKIDQALIKRQLPDYPLDTCPVTGQKLGGSMGEPVNYIYKNRLVRFCCKGCVAQFEKEPAKYLKTLDEAVIAKQKADYPLDTCVVTGQKLGTMGDAIDYVHANRLVRFCCKGCIDTFRKDPTKYMAVIDEALKAKEKK